MKALTPPLGPLMSLPDDAFCAADVSPIPVQARQSTCTGDSGGPVMKQAKNTPPVDFLTIVEYSKKDGRRIEKYIQPATLVGIVGWADGCGRAPGIYTRVVDHLDWIQSVVGGYGSASGPQ